MPHLKELGEEENFTNKNQRLKGVFFLTKKQSSILILIKEHQTASLQRSVTVTLVRLHTLHAEFSWFEISTSVRHKKHLEL